MVMIVRAEGMEEESQRRESCDHYHFLPHHHSLHFVSLMMVMKNEEPSE